MKSLQPGRAPDSGGRAGRRRGGSPGKRDGRGASMSMGLYGWACLLLTAGAAPPEPCYLNQRSFQIPIRVQPERKDDIKGLELYVSTDNGQSWHPSTKA